MTVLSDCSRIWTKVVDEKNSSALHRSESVDLDQNRFRMWSHVFKDSWHQTVQKKRELAGIKASSSTMILQNTRLQLGWGFTITSPRGIVWQLGTQVYLRLVSYVDIQWSQEINCFLSVHTPPRYGPHSLKVSSVNLLQQIGNQSSKLSQTHLGLSLRASS